MAHALAWRRLCFAASILAVALLCRTAAAEDPTIPFEKYTLDNGLEVILHQDKSVPLVAVNVLYHVGSGDETPGKSGFAHLFEHMLFQGSKHVGADKHFETLKRLGATGINGSTNTDRTNYFEVVPSRQLEAALWIESDRMGYFLPLLTEESLDNQIHVVRNERRQRIDNRPYGKTYFAVLHALFPEGHPYRYGVIGRHEDLAGASIEDVRGFYRKWYVPANATLCLAGDFDMKEAKRLVEKWFGSFPKTERPEHRDVPMPQIDGPKKLEVKDPLAKLTRIEYAWNTPAFYAPGDAELDIIGHTLAASGTGRLYKILVHEKQLAQSVRAYQESQQLSSIFHVEVTARSGADLDEIKKIVDQELEKMRSEPITKKEFDQAVVQREASFVWGLEGLMARARLLQRYNHYLGEPDAITRDLDRYRKSSPEKVRDVARQYLAKEHRVEALTTPANDSKGGNR